MPAEPWFLELNHVNELHDDSLKAYGGSVGCRDVGMVESALGAAKSAYYYGGGDFFDVAAAYAFHIAQAQAFLDGNKRTAIATALTFSHGKRILTTANGRFHPAVVWRDDCHRRTSNGQAGAGTKVMREFLSNP